MACATAALWMSTSNLVMKVPGLASHTTAEITALAMSLDRPFGPVVGRRGLTIYEMEQALLQIGFDPRIHLLPSKSQLIEICHLFSDSGIPPVLAIESNGTLHAVTVVGYTLGRPMHLPTDTVGMFSAHEFMPDLVLHDDQRGMYLRAEVSEAQIRDNPRKAKLKIYTASGTEEALCTAILVPFPRRVMLDAIEVQGQSEEWIKFAKDIGAIEKRTVVCRTLLVKSNAYKQLLLRDRETSTTIHGYPRDFVTFARSLPMPRYIWLIEVSYLDEWDPADPLSPPVIAHFVLDSTLTEAMRPDILLAHLPGVALGQLVKETGTKFIHRKVSNDHPHQPFPDVPRP